MNDDLFLTALKALEKPLCDRCLGRLFARSGFGLTNQQRGRSVRVSLALWIESYSNDPAQIKPEILRSLPVHNKEKIIEEEEKGEFLSAEDGWKDTETPSITKPWSEDDTVDERCWLCRDIFSNVDHMAELVRDHASDIEFDTFLIGCRIDPQTVKREQLLWQSSDPPDPEPLKEEMNREIGKRFQALVPGPEYDRADPDVAFVIDPLYRKITTQIKPVFIYGRYRKLERGIPQTRWPCRRCRGKGCDRCNGTGRMYQTSVEEMIGDRPVKVFKGNDFKLHGMGREDVDVLCTGMGRPFILEISRPNARKCDLSDLERMINDSASGRVEVNSLREASRKEIPGLKDTATRKSYRAKITLSGDINEEKLKYNISLLAQSPINQRTPTRVVHRRADKVRVRKVHEADLEAIHQDGSVIDLTTDGGLYIKELLHGDGGRTEPSLASLLEMDVEVISLDVTGVHYDDGD